MPLLSLDNPIQPYAWGSRTVIAELLGQPSPSPQPQAELWMGAHPSAPSRVWNAGRSQPLLELIESDPQQFLGDRVLARFGLRLPFLLKVLAAETPLSLQAHPNQAQAERGFKQEERSGLSRDAPNRNYKDPNHKPELLAALGPFEALCGFRDAIETAKLFEALDVAELGAYAKRLRAEPALSALRSVFSDIMRSGPEQRAALIGETLQACERHPAATDEFASACNCVLELGAMYPGDPGVVTALMLNLLRLEPGEALFLPAGNLHAYLRGAGVEIMSSSDNVLRGGLTPKHVDLTALLEVLDFSAGPVTAITPAARPDGVELIYPCPAPEFRLSRMQLDGQASWKALDRRGPEILLCVAGQGQAREMSGQELTLARGNALFVTASVGQYELRGVAQVFRATVGAG
jgi:mannose-6-phosphate isomerase